MRITRRATKHGAEAESLGAVRSGGAEAPIIEAHRFRAAALEKDLAILRACDSFAQDRERALLVQMGFERLKSGHLLAPAGRIGRDIWVASGPSLRQSDQMPQTMALRARMHCGHRASKRRIPIRYPEGLRFMAALADNQRMKTPAGEAVSELSQRRAETRGGRMKRLQMLVLGALAALSANAAM